MIDEMHCGYGYQRTTAVRKQHHACSRAVQRSQLLLTPLADLHRSLSCSKIWLSYVSTIRAFWMHLHNRRCFQEHLRMPLQSLRVVCSATAGPTSISKYWKVLIMSTEVPGWFVCGILKHVHFTDGEMKQRSGHLDLCWQLATIYTNTVLGRTENYLQTFMIVHRLLL